MNTEDTYMRICMLHGHPSCRKIECCNPIACAGHTMPMETEKLRRMIAFRAARLLQNRQAADFRDARNKAMRSVTRSFVPPECLPKDIEIRLALQDLVADRRHSREEAVQTAVGSDDDDLLPESRFEDYLALLQPLDRVIQDPEYHPEGDVLYHSLQVFELVRESCDWDEELLLAALLHDVGKGIDPRAPLPATLAAVAAITSERTRWLIEHQQLAHSAAEGTIGIRARRRLLNSEDGEALQLLASCDREGRVPGRIVCTAEEAVCWVRQMHDSD